MTRTSRFAQEYRIEPRGEAHVYSRSLLQGPLRQGEVLAGVHYTKLTLDSVRQGTDDKTAPIAHPCSVVVSQDCDLDQGWKKRSARALDAPAILPCVLLREARVLDDLPIDAPRVRIRSNREDRFHSIERLHATTDLQAVGHPELVLYFKRYFVVPTDELYLRIELGRIKRRARLRSPYREHLSTRFAYYQFRVDLPRPHHSEGEPAA